MMKNKKIFGLISLIIIAVGLIMYFVSGGFVKDFALAGGTDIVIDMGKDVSADEVSAIVKEKAPEARVTIQKLGDNQISIKGDAIDGGTFKEVQTALNEKYELADSAYKSINFTNSSAGNDMLMQLVKMILIAIAVIVIIYISVKFAFAAAVGLVIALVHDILIVLTAYVLFRFPMNQTFAALLLVLIAYALFNNLMIFNRIKVNRKKLKAETFQYVVDLSNSQSTAGIVHYLIAGLIIAACLCILGSASVRMFAVLLLVGMLSCAYSSLYIASPVWGALHKEYDDEEEETVKKR